MENPIKRRPEASERATVLRTWVWGADVHSTLLIVGSRVELRVEHDGVVIRRDDFDSLRTALEAAREWRVEYELRRAQLRDVSAMAFRCPQCRDEASVDAPTGDGPRLYCQTCGHVWQLDLTD